MASDSGWQVETDYGDAGWDQTSNNSSGFNVIPVGYRYQSGFGGESTRAGFWSTNENSQQQGYAFYRYLFSGYSFLQRDINLFSHGHSVRLVKE